MTSQKLLLPQSLTVKGCTKESSRRFEAKKPRDRQKKGNN